MRCEIDVRAPNMDLAGSPCNQRKTVMDRLLVARDRITDSGVLPNTELRRGHASPMSSRHSPPLTERSHYLHHSR